MCMTCCLNETYINVNSEQIYECQNTVGVLTFSLVCAPFSCEAHQLL